MKRILSALRSLAVFAAVAPAAFGALAQAPQPPEIAARTLTGSFWSSAIFLARSASNTR